MKKSLFPICAPLCAVALLLFSCSEVSTEITTPSEDACQEQLYQVTHTDIMALLQKNNPMKTKSGPTDMTIDPYVWEGDTVMFLVNDAKGWQLISADKRACPIVVYANDEHKSLEDIMGSPMLGGWVSDVAKDIHTLKKGNYPIENENTKYWNYVEGKASAVKTKSLGPGWRLICTIDISSNSTEIDHIIPTKWGGGEPWNDCFPEDVFLEKMPVGSHNVAIAQILYWANKQMGVPEYSYTNVTATTNEIITVDSLNSVIIYDTYPVFSFGDSSSVVWSQMKTHYNGSGNSDYVSYLMAKVRSLTNLVSPEDYTVAEDLNALDYFQLQSSNRNYAVDTVIRYLFQGIPSIIITDVHSNEYVYDTRACIADAYYGFTNTFEEYYIYDPYETYNGLIDIDLEYATPEDVILVLPEGYEWCSEQHNVSMRYISMNWGLNGEGDNQRYSVYSTLWDWVHYSMTTEVSPWKMIYNFRAAN